MSEFDETVSGTGKNDEPAPVGTTRSFPRLPYGLISRLAAHFSLTPAAIKYRLRTGHQKTIQQAYAFMKADIEDLENELRRLRYKRIEEAQSTIRTIIDLSHEARIARMKQCVFEFEDDKILSEDQQALFSQEIESDLEHA